MPYVQPAERYVFSRRAYAWEGLDEDRIEIIPPSIDAFAPKNQAMDPSNARAILAAARILILDEATSSLDSESEALIRDGLRSLRRGRTTFVIAHRLSTIRSADQILVLEAGEIVERGTHEELLRAGGRYRQLYNKQHGIEHDTFINPGEDLTPEPPSPLADVPSTVSETSSAL